MSDRKTWDPIVDPVREIRMRISAQFDHDPAKLGEHLMEYQKQFADRLVSFSGDESPGDESPGDEPAEDKSAA